MIYEKEIVVDPAGTIRYNPSLTVIEAGPFARARVKQCGYGLLDRPFSVTRIANRGFHVFVITLSGKGEILFEDGSSIIQQSGDVFISWATGQGHYEHTVGDNPWEMIWFSVWDCSPRFKPTSIDWERRKFTETECNMLKAPFMHIMKEETYDDSRSLEAIECYENLFFIQFERAMELNGQVHKALHRAELATLWQQVQNNSSKRWSVKELERISGFSRSHLTRLCIELYGKSPGRIVKEILMNMAKVLLRNSDYTIGEIADRLGFSNMSTFSVAFKEYSGQSPNQYRKDDSNKIGTP